MWSCMSMNVVPPSNTVLPYHLRAEPVKDAARGRVLLHPVMGSAKVLVERRGHWRRSESGLRDEARRVAAAAKPLRA
jgi:hypothetical protein